MQYQDETDVILVSHQYKHNRSYENARTKHAEDFGQHYFNSSDTVANKIIVFENRFKYRDFSNLVLLVDLFPKVSYTYFQIR